jgi:hypothetical protein
MSYVFLLDTTLRPVNPVHPGRARLLLKEGKPPSIDAFPLPLCSAPRLQLPSHHCGSSLIRARSGQ